MSAQRPLRPSPNDPLFVGFAGRMGSGKTSAATYLNSKYLFQYVRYSQVLDRWRAGNTQDQVRLQQLGWDIMSGGLQKELNSRLVASLDRSRSAAIDGLRHMIDFESLSASFGTSFGLIFLEAGEGYRFERLSKRFGMFGAFKEADSHPVEAHIESLRPLAALTISNEHSLDDLHKQLDAWIASFGVRDRT
jgi:dephospho-CoA kinase